jgi:cytochrome b
MLAVIGRRTVAPTPHRPGARSGAPGQGDRACLKAAFSRGDDDDEIVNPPRGRPMSPESTPPPARRPILVWDAPVRVFHWLLAACFLGAFVTAENDRLLQLHVTLGYTVGGLVVFRLLWGLLGTRHARFASFVRGPRAVADYLKALRDGQPLHPVGHNPAGAWAIVALLAGAMLVVASGWATLGSPDGGWLEDLHEGSANALLALVAVHVLGVLVGSRLHHQNLVRSMLTGRQLGRAEDGIQQAWRSVAALMVVAVAGFWSWQWLHATDATTVSAQATARHDRDHDRDPDRHQGPRRDSD